MGFLELQLELKEGGEKFWKGSGGVRVGFHLRLDLVLNACQERNHNFFLGFEVVVDCALANAGRGRGTGAGARAGRVEGHLLA